MRDPQTRRCWQAIATACCLTLLAVPVATAQPSPDQPQVAASTGPDSSAPRVQVGLGALLGIPSGDFSDNVGLSGGLGGDVGYRPVGSPFSLGAEVSVLWYGRNTRRVPFSLTVPDVLVDVTTSSAIVMTHARLRAQPGRGRVRPYVDALIGFNYVFTETSVDLDDAPFGDHDSLRTTNFSDFAFSAGAGAGVMIRLTSVADGRLNLDFNARYLYGGDADYLIPGLLVLGGSVADLEVHRSRTDVVMLRFGAAFEF